MTAEDRDFAVFQARVYLNQARVFRLRPERSSKRFAVTLLEWASKSRRRASQYVPPPAPAVQGDLFQQPAQVHRP